MHTLLRAFLDLMAPPQADVRALRDVAAADFRSRYCPGRRGRITILSSYRDPLLQHAIRALKFYHHDRAAPLLSELLMTYLEKAALPPTLFVPIPLSAARERTRGYNQVTAVLEIALRAYPTHRLSSQLLARTRDTAPQSHLTRGERLKNVTGCFSTGKLPPECAGLPIVVVDDVTTTGTTLTEAISTLKKTLPRGTRISGLALCG